MSETSPFPSSCRWMKKLLLFCSYMCLFANDDCLPDEGATERALIDDEPGRVLPSTGLSHLASETRPKLVSFACHHARCWHGAHGLW